MLYQTSLCFTMLPYALPDLSVLYNASLCFSRPLCALQCFPMLYQTSLCFTMLPYALPDLSVLYNASLCFTRPLCALQCFPMLYQTSLCFTMLPYALPDLSVLYNASLCFTRPLCALQCFPMLYQTSLCFTMLPYALPDLSVLYNASLCFTRPLCALQCFPMLYQTSLCFTMLPYALPDLSVLYNASLCCTRPLCALQCFPMLYQTSLCFTMLPYAVPDLSVFYNASLCFTRPLCALQCFPMLYHTSLWSKCYTIGAVSYCHPWILTTGEIEDQVPPMARALKDGMPERRGGIAGGNPVNCGGGGGGGGSSGTCRSEAVRVESLRRRNNHPLMMGYQYCRHYMQTHSTQPPLTQHGTPTPLCSSQHHSHSQVQQESPSFHALPGMLQRNQRPLADTPQNCSPASPDQGEEDDLSGMVAEQLRIIGDEMNDIYEQRRHEAQDWHHWRGLWRGLYSFITETLTVGYLRGLR
ncbi:uncharacterized protein LOC131737460 isoform X2 [Acipenser ruthenus]|uniref:uncharacterized protein LOC131737460 isoform X2 n=1 Tax=Acipenser ruthenus TaxID=7906 RepID=UPI0027423DA5|nr:uncharacterized protein LOC131737460 isoform X2 [Acipenser ruthenus]